MSTRRATWLSWSIWTLSVAFNTASLVLHTANDPTTFAINIFAALVLGAFATVGALIAARRPENRIGWLLSVSSLAWVIGGAMLEYGVYALLTAPGSLPAGAWMAWYGFGVRGGAFALIATFLPLIFPDGRLPSRRWRWAAWLAVSSLALFGVTALLGFGTSSQDYRLPFLHNPLGIELPAALSSLLSAIYPLVALAAEAAGAAAMVSRFRRAKGDERQQLKWFAYAAVLGAIVFLVLVILNTVELPISLEDRIRLGTFLFDLLVAGFPIAVGVAILKYRLYDIDIIINRTLVYGALTAALALVYVGCVVVLQTLVSAFTNQGHSELVTVASTLVIAALFTPLRRRIQISIDKRFYRRKYDAAKTLAAFSAKLRDETDLDALSADLLNVVDETMQPTHVSLWLQIPEREVKR
jgi:hypothetical protein